MIAFRHRIRKNARLTFLWLFFCHILYDVFGEGLNSVHLSEHLAYALSHFGTIVYLFPNVFFLHLDNVCDMGLKLKDMMTDHYILCVVTFCFMGTLA